VRHHRDRSDELEACGLAGDEGGGGQLLVAIAARTRRKLAGVAVGIAGRNVGRDHDMVADRAIVVPDRLARGEDPRQALGTGKRAADRRAEAILHLFLPAGFAAPQPSRTRPVWRGGNAEPGVSAIGEHRSRMRRAYPRSRAEWQRRAALRCG
jgi:hypothetical protein